MIHGGARSLLGRLGLLLIGSTSVAANDVGFQTDSRGIVRIRQVCTLENPRPDGKGVGTGFLLPEMPADGPYLAAVWATGYRDCTVGFYGADFRLLAQWREPVAQGDMVMCVTSGDLDDDGTPEIVLSVRLQAPGAYALRWNKQTRQLEPKWSFLDVQRGRFYRGVCAGNFTSHPGREVCFGGDGTGLYLLDQHGRLIRHDRTIGNTIQRIDVCDADRDGHDEMIVSVGRNPGRVYYARWAKDLSLQVLWSADVTPGGRGGNNCYEALYHPNGHPKGGPAIAVNTEKETPPQAGSILLLDMKGRELWRYVYDRDEERGGACGFADVTGDGVPEIISRYRRVASEPREKGVLVLDNRGKKLARLPGVEVGTAGPYVFRPRGAGTRPLYLLGQNRIYEIQAETPR